MPPILGGEYIRLPSEAQLWLPLKKNKEKPENSQGKLMAQALRKLGEAGRNNTAVACLGLGSHGRLAVSPMAGLVLPVEGLGKSAIEIVDKL